MTLKELKESIEDGTFQIASMILVAEDKFVPLQYVEEIKKFPDTRVIYIESINDIPQENDIFSCDTSKKDDELYVLNIPIVDFCNELVYTNNNIMIITNKINQDSRSFYRDLIIDVPKIVDWQLKDMVYSYCRGVDHKKLDWLLQCCGGDVTRLYNESLKLNIFNECDRESVFVQMCLDGAFDDLVTNTIFNLTNSISKKDIETLKDVYSEIDNMDVNGFGLLTILLNNFQNILQIQMGINPTAEKLGMRPGQFNAIKHNCGKYSNSQLISIVRFLSELDFKIKSGELPTNILIDYMITSILSF